MLRKIARGYGALLGTAGKVAALLAVCAALGCAVVLPLWKFATAAPRAYTAAVLVCMGAAAAVLLVRKARAAGARRFAAGLLKVAVALGGAAGCVALVMRGSRLLALVALVAAVGLYGAVSFTLGKRQA